jgi:hypothetical protein
LSDRKLAAWSARDLETHLDELTAATRHWRDGKGERSLVTLHLASGARHTGYVLERTRTTLTLEGPPQRGTCDIDVMVIPIARIEALTLHAAQTLVEVPRVPDSATSMLDLRRRAKALADMLSTRVGKPIAIEIDGGELAELGPLFEHVKLALERVCADQLGRGSLAERVQRVELGGGGPSISLANGALVIRGPVSADRLQRDIDNAL